MAGWYNKRSVRRRGCLLALVLLAPLTAAAESGEADASRVSVQIETASASPGDAVPLGRLREQLEARLLQEGFAVVPDGAGTDIALRLSPRGLGWWLRAVLPAETLEREVVDCGVQRAEERLELVQKATELARKALLRSREIATAATP